MVVYMQTHQRHADGQRSEPMIVGARRRWDGVVGEASVTTSAGVISSRRSNVDSHLVFFLQPLHNKFTLISPPTCSMMLQPEPCCSDVMDAEFSPITELQPFVKDIYPR
jgi:hypothetical protein